MKKTPAVIVIVVLLLSGCAKQTVIPTETFVPAAPTPFPTETNIPPTETSIPAPTQAPDVFGAIGQNEIQAFALESVVNAIFKKTFDGFVADSSIQEYQVTSVTVFPGSGGLLAEVIYNVRSTDPASLSDGGTQSADGWINDKCNRFDFVNTETEFQLKNRRTCN